MLGRWHCVERKAATYSTPASLKQSVNAENCSLPTSSYQDLETEKLQDGEREGGNLSLLPSGFRPGGGGKHTLNSPRESGT